MPEGKIKKILAEKGFGFIEGEKGDIFFHHSALVGVAIEALREGEAVMYDIGHGPKGPHAENVERV
jgi:CspA family cold shock protein